LGTKLKTNPKRAPIWVLSARLQRALPAFQPPRPFRLGARLKQRTSVPPHHHLALGQIIEQTLLGDFSACGQRGVEGGLGLGELRSGGGHVGAHQIVLLRA